MHLRQKELYHKDLKPVVNTLIKEERKVRNQKRHEKALKRKKNKKRKQRRR